MFRTTLHVPAPLKNDHSVNEDLKKVFLKFGSCGKEVLPYAVIAFVLNMTCLKISYVI